MRVINAMNRFGWGPRGTSVPRTPPGEWLAKQLTDPDGAAFPGTQPSSEGLIALREQRRAKMRGDPLVKPIFLTELSTQLDVLLGTEQPFRERLVWFWSNHFTVSLRQGSTRAVMGAYVREAIRPHVTGCFSDMLMAVMRHPAMLMYLDNTSSIGPDSRAGLKSHRGLNENLARECLELHTLSPAAGYTQTDVTSLAAILTGWTVDMKADTPGFTFRASAHEPGDKTLMGRTFPEGEDGGVQALMFLGTHSATYHHLATQLVTYFITDTPSPDHIKPVTETLLKTGGDLRAAALAVTSLADAWRPPGKFRSPLDYATAVMRALSIGGQPSTPDDAHSPAHMLASAFGALGQPLWTAPLPNGWGDLAADWCTPADMLARADWAWRLSAHARDAEPMDVADATLGPALRSQTRTAMKHAGSRQDALALLFSSPEFQRR